MKQFYITTPIYYVNDKPHIGHAYTTIAADILARWMRFKGEKTFYLTGTDEHGSKVALSAKEHGCSPKEYVDKLVTEFQSLWKLLNISNDDFIRTTDERHEKTVQQVFQKLYDQGDIVKGFYEDWFCVPCETFWLESEIIEGKCPDCKRPVEKLKEETYFFKLSNYEKRLLDHYEKNPEFLSPSHRAQEIINFVKSGLKDLSVSRLKEKWGIQVPFDPTHTIYVWFDALINYISAIGYDRSQMDKGNFEEIWPCDVHFVGKEIYRFHTVIWPAMLMALKLPLPKRVYAHGWWTVEGDKMSKSKGNVVDPVKVTQEFGVDSFRYFLLKEIPFGVDGDYSTKALKIRYNSELANDLGNLFSRTLTLIEKNFGGVLKIDPEGLMNATLKNECKQIEQAYEKIAFHEVLDRLMKIVTESNRFLEQKAPWTLAKTDLNETEKVLTESLFILRWIAAGFYPFMPGIAQQMWHQLGEDSSIEEVGWKVLQDPLTTFAKGKKVRKEGILFPRKI